MKLIIDRIEEKYAVCENEEKEFINIDISKLPNDVKIGDIIILNDGEFIIDKKETKKRKDYIDEITKDIWQ